MSKITLCTHCTHTYISKPSISSTNYIGSTYIYRRTDECDELVLADISEKPDIGEGNVPVLETTKPI